MKQQRLSLGLLFLTSLMVVLTAPLGFWLGIMANEHMLSLLRDTEWWLVLRIGAFGLGMLSYGCGLILMTNVSLWQRVREKGFGSKPHLIALLAALSAGLGFGAVYVSAFP